MEPHGDGALFIDRDGTHFRFILNYLRSGKLTFPEGATALAEFKEEADFYQIQGILDELDDTKRRYRLLFRASRDSQLRLFTPNVTSKDQQLPLCRVETTNLVALQIALGGVSCVH